MRKLRKLEHQGETPRVVRPSNAHFNELPEIYKDILENIRGNINKNIKPDEPMEGQVSSSSQPPPPPPTTPLTTKGRRGRKKKQPEEEPPVIHDPPIILKPSDIDELNNSQPGRAKAKAKGRPRKIKVSEVNNVDDEEPSRDQDQDQGQEVNQNQKTKAKFPPQKNIYLMTNNDVLIKKIV